MTTPAMEHAARALHTVPLAGTDPYEKYDTRLAYAAVRGALADTDIIAETLKEHSARSMLFIDEFHCTCGWIPDRVAAKNKTRTNSTQHYEHQAEAIVAAILGEETPPKEET